MGGPSRLELNTGFCWEELSVIRKKRCSFLRLREEKGGEGKRGGGGAKKPHQLTRKLEHVSLGSAEVHEEPPPLCFALVPHCHRWGPAPVSVSMPQHRLRLYSTIYSASFFNCGLIKEKKSGKRNSAIYNPLLLCPPPCRFRCDRIWNRAAPLFRL